LEKIRPVVIEIQKEQIFTARYRFEKVLALLLLYPQPCQPMFYFPGLILEVKGERGGAVGRPERSLEFLITL
jgi:hypothetical protein